MTGNISCEKNRRTTVAIQATYTYLFAREKKHVASTINAASKTHFSLAMTFTKTAIISPPRRRFSMLESALSWHEDRSTGDGLVLVFLSSVAVCQYFPVICANKHSVFRRTDEGRVFGGSTRSRHGRTRWNYRFSRIRMRSSSPKKNDNNNSKSLTIIVRCPSRLSSLHLESH